MGSMDLKESVFVDVDPDSNYKIFVTNRVRKILDLHSWDRLRLALQELRRRHLLRQGVYLRLRNILPVPILVLFWLTPIQSTQPHGLHTLLKSSLSFDHISLVVIVTVVWNTCLLFKPHKRRSTRRDVQLELRLLICSSFACGLLIFIVGAVSSNWQQAARIGLSVTTEFLAGSLLLLLGAFFVSAQLLSYPSRSRRALIIGSGPRASFMRSIIRSGHSHFEVIGCMDDEYIGADREKDNYLGPLDGLPDLLRSEPVELVLIGLPVKSRYEDIQNVIAVCESVGVESHYMSDIFATTRASHQSSAFPSHFAVLGDPPNDLRHWIKRGMDLFIAGLMCLLLSPVMLTIAIAMKLTNPGPIFFVQRRYGLHRHQFPMYKFRTMVVDAEQQQAALEGANEAQGPVFKMKADPRVTKIGAFLRRTSLDELPQLFNVLRGEMSLVGPRPLPLRDVSRFEKPWLLRRFSVRPGLTCLWQVRGRSNTTFDEWIKLDLAYIDTWSLGLDLVILIQTIPAVLKGSGAM
jgi:exopolysaccharide biosynthesis polyprenyl glycosylphosphotransferase